MTKLENHTYINIEIIKLNSECFNSYKNIADKRPAEANLDLLNDAYTSHTPSIWVVIVPFLEHSI